MLCYVLSTDIVIDIVNSTTIGKRVSHHFTARSDIRDTIARLLILIGVINDVIGTLAAIVVVCGGARLIGGWVKVLLSWLLLSLLGVLLLDLAELVEVADRVGLLRLDVDHWAEAVRGRVLVDAACWCHACLQVAVAVVATNATNTAATAACAYSRLALCV